MLKLKLKRIGKKHQPSYRLVVDEKRSKLLGKNIEDLGWYDPNVKKHEFNKDRILHWIKNGAKPSDTVHNLLIKAGVIDGKKIAVHKKSKKEEEVKDKEAPTSAESVVGVPTSESVGTQASAESGTKVLPPENTEAKPEEKPVE